MPTVSGAIVAVAMGALGGFLGALTIGAAVMWHRRDQVRLRGFGATVRDMLLESEAVDR